MKISFIGCGSMGEAMARGILGSGLCAPQDMMITTSRAASLKEKKQRLGTEASLDNREAAAFADVLFLCVKPKHYHDVICEIRDVVRREQILVTVAPGRTLDWLSREFGRPLKLVRTMPNTPAMVGEGMTALCPNGLVTDGDLKTVRGLCEGFSRTEVVTEDLMDAVTAVSGSSPAYVFLFLEAMADAAVAEGMPRAQAYRFAAQAVLGSAKMALESGKHPGELKDMVCSPAGTTIEAVGVLEEMGFRGAVFDAVRACAERSREI